MSQGSIGFAEDRAGLSARLRVGLPSSDGFRIRYRFAVLLASSYRVMLVIVGIQYTDVFFRSRSHELIYID